MVKTLFLLMPKICLPSPYFLDLKIGAQVQFTQNNPTYDVVNGTIGKVIGFSENYVQVEVLSTKAVVMVLS